MASQDDPTKPKRLKFSRLCLSQNRNTAAPATDFVRTSTHVSSSQISRFFTHSKSIDETHRKTENVTQTQSANAESNDCLEAATAAQEATKTKCDNDNQPLSGGNDKFDENKSLGNKRKHSRKCDKKTDSKSTIKSFFSNELNDSLADFELPTKVVKIMPKVLPSKVVKSSRSRRKQQPDIRKALNKEQDALCPEDYSHLSEDAQLELALAISKAESVNGVGSAKPIDLEAFTFKPTNSKSCNNGDALNFFNMNRQTKARFKWNSKCTLLTRRNDDTEKSKVRTKIDEIILNNIIVESNQVDRLKASEQIDTIDYSPHCVHSRRLQRICVSERILFELNHCDRNTKTDLRSYYTNNLVDASELGAEALLKDWSKIPGRDSIYDGIQKTENEIIETDTMTVISSSPEYDIHTESSLSEAGADKCDDQIENAFIVTNDQQMDTAGCSNATQSGPMASMEIIESDCAAQSVDDQDRTLIMDISDIQSKIDAINSNIRLGQQFCDTFQKSDFTCQAATTTRAPSPDLFDDDDVVVVGNDDVAESEEIQETNDRQSPATEDDDTRAGTIESASEDVIMISSSEGNTNECNTDPVCSEDFQCESQFSNTHDNEKSTEKGVIETIEILDSDSENMLKDRIDSPKIQLSQAAGKNEANTSAYVLPDMESLENEFQDIMQSVGCATHELPNNSTKSSDTSTEFKKLSFTERLELFEKDVLNGFTADLPAEILSQSQQQLSQESIDLSDDEINYSMRKGAKRRSSTDDNRDDFDINHLTDEYGDEVESPIDYDSNSNSNSNANHSDSEQKLVNQSVCNIFEKTFEQCVSPIQLNKKLSGAKTLKKFQSETVLSTHYGHDAPSTSAASSNRNQITPKKNMNKFQFESPQKDKIYSPISQPPVETRMDLSNDEYYIRIGSISPKPNYEQMDACTLETELRKYGLKPSLSRRQAIICLDYIYNRTHPFMESGTELGKSSNDNECNSNSQLNTVDKATCIDADSKDPQINFNVGFAAQNLVDEKFKCREVNKIFLPSVPRAKKPWCLEPLHIAWQNLITANPDLRKAVLLYEPINLVELKKFFKTIDMTFDNRDLIAFLDLHCITFRMIKASRD